MIELTKFNGDSFSFNAIYIEQVQSNPDTTITSTTGRTFLVEESEEEVIRKITHFYKKVGLVKVMDKKGENTP
jgi:flagellar protein FlbD